MRPMSSSSVKVLCLLTLIGGGCGGTDDVEGGPDGAPQADGSSADGQAAADGPRAEIGGGADGGVTPGMDTGIGADSAPSLDLGPAPDTAPVTGGWQNITAN